MGKGFGAGAELVSRVPDMRRGMLTPVLIFKGATGKGGDAVLTHVCRRGKKSSKKNGFMEKAKNTAPSIRKSAATAKSRETANDLAQFL
jgi:hypothetical protein